jgi:hypothetical protein
MRADGVEFCRDCGFGVPVTDPTPDPKAWVRRVIDAFERTSKGEAQMAEADRRERAGEVVVGSLAEARARRKARRD